ncbi:energy transducer TonB [Chryseobacterium sp. CBSDS_008]|uniref:energy transducer TonB n=1 Tax=Chryseobacterium sp. CBSDS_008 TaxID=3415265 RepID=UPI003CFA10F1
MKKKLIVFFLAFVSVYKAQILDEYPEKQSFYEGGTVNFYKDAHEYLVNNNFKECSEKEIYQPRIIVTEKAEVKFIKDSDTANIARNKCAYDLSRILLKNLKKWKPAEAKGWKIGAITEFILYPKDLMSNYKPGYDAGKFVAHAKYPEGAKAFHTLFHDNFMTIFSDYQLNGKVNLEFYISKDGHIINPRIYPEVDNKNFNTDFMRTLSRMKKVWVPAFYKNIPIVERISFPVQFSITFTER